MYSFSLKSIPVHPKGFQQGFVQATGRSSIPSFLLHFCLYSPIVLLYVHTFLSLFMIVCCSPVFRHPTSLPLSTLLYTYPLFSAVLCSCPPSVTLVHPCKCVSEVNVLLAPLKAIHNAEFHFHCATFKALDCSRASTVGSNTMHKTL